MGGKNETTISGLRMHIDNSCKVHVHDDSKKLKYERTNGNFKAEVEDAFKVLEDGDGVIKIDGDTNTSIFLVKNNKSFDMFLKEDKNNVKKDLTDFLKGC